MQKFTIGKGIDLDFGATQPATVFNMNPHGRGVPYDTPIPQCFNAGATAILVMEAQGWIQAEQNGVSMGAQGSDNAFSGFATLLDTDGNSCVVGGINNSPLAMYEIEIPEYLRLRNLSATAGDGYGSAYLLSN